MKKRFGNFFLYESTDFHGRYVDCTLLEDVPAAGHLYAMAGETFPHVIVDLEKSEMHFFEEFEEYLPMFTVHFKMSYV